MQAFFLTPCFLGIKVLCSKETIVFSFTKHFMKSEKFILFCGVGIGQFLEFSNSISKKGGVGGEAEGEEETNMDKRQKNLFHIF